MAKKDTWKIELEQNTATFTRIHDGRVVESYASVTLDKAAIYAASIIQGFQPPRCLLNLDTPVD